MHLPTAISTPVDHILKKEMDESILKLGAFLSIIYNKKINQSKFLIIILKNKKLQKYCIEISNSITLKNLIENILHRYPSLYRSKILYKAIKRATHGKRL